MDVGCEEARQTVEEMPNNSFACNLDFMILWSVPAPAPAGVIC